MKRVIVAITGASGIIYAKKVLESLSRVSGLEEIALIVSDNGNNVMKWEKVVLPEGIRNLKRYKNTDMFAPPASGSAEYDAMVIVPCSMGTVGRIAAGISADLIGRAADVIIKEQKKLLLLVRENPLSTVHLKNLASLSGCGTSIMMAAPSFYSRPENLDDLLETVVERVMKMLDVESSRYKWAGSTIGY